MRRVLVSQSLAPRGVVAAGVAVAVLLAGCASSDPQASAPPASGTAPVGVLPDTHFHGVAFDPADGTLLMATHDGLFRVDEKREATRVGPVIDLMGFAVAGPGHFLASGHPGPGVDLPQPVGLIESTDGGRTWTPRSRQGESDFHALTVSSAGILGYDGSLARTVDKAQWEELAISAEPATLAASADGRQILATTQQGLLLSEDAGSSWSPVEGAPLLQVVAWAEDGTSVVGVDPSGQVWTSADRAATWSEGARLGSAPYAVTARSSDGALRVAVITAAALLESRDSGRTFEVVLEN